MIHVDINILNSSLFPEFEPAAVRPPVGLNYIEEFITVSDELHVALWIDSQSWSMELSRRRQFYGGGYESEGETEKLPPLLAELANRLCQSGLFPRPPDRCLINEYLPGQGIAAHVDYHPKFGDQVAMISLLDSYPMRFAHLKSELAYEKWLARRSVCVIAGPSRYDWTHEILKRRADMIPGGGRRLRGRRISITFRTLETP